MTLYLNGRPATLARWADKIDDIYRQPDGSWDISLKRGWRCAETETHGIIENTLREVAGKCRSIEPCHCDQCEAS